MRLAVQIVLSIIMGFALMFPLGWFYGVMNWPTFHSWGLGHESFFSAWPTLGLVSFVLLSLIPWFARVTDAPLIATAALIGLGMTSVLVVAERSGGIRAPIYLLALTFACAIALCFFAKRRWLVALTIALPMIFFDSQFLMLPLMYGRTDGLLGYMHFSVLSTTLPIILSAFLGMGIAYAAHRALRA